MRVMQVDAEGHKQASEHGANMALADSGATHALRPPRSNREWYESATVDVQLAGSIHKSPYV